MAKRTRGAAPVDDEPVTLESEGLGDVEHVFPDAKDAGGGLDDNKTVVLVEEEPAAPPGPGTSPEAKGGGDGKEKTPEQLKKENQNLRGALKETRGQRRSLLAEVELLRQQRAQQERTAAEQQRKRQSDVDLGKLEDASDLREAAPIIIKAAREQILPDLDLAQRRIIKQSQRIAELAHEDYHEVLTESGLVDLIRVDANGTPKDPDLWRKIYVEEEDPGEAAYQLALELRARKDGRDVTAGDPDLIESNETPGDRATGRREVVDQLRRTAERPSGIRNISPTAPPPSRRFTRRQIDQMTDEQRARLPDDVIEEWLAGAPGA
jgi:TolA-binding protein